MLAALAIFVPVLHFVLVPSLLVVTAWMTYREFKKSLYVSGFETTCEKCREPIRFEGAVDSFLIRTHCSHCMVQNSIDLTSFEKSL